jgi:hypothetical protein
VKDVPSFGTWEVILTPVVHPEVDHVSADVCDPLTVVGLALAVIVQGPLTVTVTDWQGGVVVPVAQNE